jgi:hypothetical protein
MGTEFWQDTKSSLDQTADEQGTLARSPFRFKVEEVVAVYPSIIDPKCTTVVFKSGHTVDLWNHIAKYLILEMDTMPMSGPLGKGYVQGSIPSGYSPNQILPQATAEECDVLPS